MVTRAVTPASRLHHATPGPVRQVARSLVEAFPTASGNPALKSLAVLQPGQTVAQHIHTQLEVEAQIRARLNPSEVHARNQRQAETRFGSVHSSPYVHLLSAAGHNYLGAVQGLLEDIGTVSGKNDFADAMRKGRLDSEAAAEYRQQAAMAQGRIVQWEQVTSTQAPRSFTPVLSDQDGPVLSASAQFIEYGLRVGEYTESLILQSASDLAFVLAGGVGGRMLAGAAGIRSAAGITTAGIAGATVVATPANSGRVLAEQRQHSVSHSQTEKTHLPSALGIGAVNSLINALLGVDRIFATLKLGGSTGSVSGAQLSAVAGGESIASMTTGSTQRVGAKAAEPRLAYFSDDYYRDLLAHGRDGLLAGWAVGSTAQVGRGALGAASLTSTAHAPSQALGTAVTPTTGNVVSLQLPHPWRRGNHHVYQASGWHFPDSAFDGALPLQRSLDTSSRTAPSTIARTPRWRLILLSDAQLSFVRTFAIYNYNVKALTAADNYTIRSYNYYNAYATAVRTLLNPDITSWKAMEKSYPGGLGKLAEDVRAEIDSRERGQARAVNFVAQRSTPQSSADRRARRPDREQYGPSAHHVSYKHLEQDPAAPAPRAMRVTHALHEGRQRIEQTIANTKSEQIYSQRYATVRVKRIDAETAVVRMTHVEANALPRVMASIQAWIDKQSDGHALRTLRIESADTDLPTLRSQFSTPNQNAHVTVEDFYVFTHGRHDLDRTLNVITLALNQTRAQADAHAPMLEGTARAYALQTLFFVENPVLERPGKPVTTKSLEPFLSDTAPTKATAQDSSPVPYISPQQQQLSNAELAALHQILTNGPGHYDQRRWTATSLVQQIRTDIPSANWVRVENVVPILKEHNLLELANIRGHAVKGPYTLTPQQIGELRAAITANPKEHGIHANSWTMEPMLALMKDKFPDADIHSPIQVLEVLRQIDFSPEIKTLISQLHPERHLTLAQQNVVRTQLEKGPSVIGSDKPWTHRAVAQLLNNLFGHDHSVATTKDIVNTMYMNGITHVRNSFPPKHVNSAAASSTATKSAASPPTPSLRDALSWVGLATSGSKKNE